jgi:glycerol kinase
MQFQADILDRKVIRPAMRETTALGAAYAAGLASGFYRDIEHLAENWEIDQVWRPQMEAGRREHLYKQWKKAVTRSFDWVDE